MWDRRLFQILLQRLVLRSVLQSWQGSCSYLKSIAMQLLLPPQIIKRLHRELRRAGRKEIGGLLMGEHVRDEIFRLVDISVQRSGGSQACFIRNPADHQAQLQEFFGRTAEDYRRFN